MLVGNAASRSRVGPQFSTVGDFGVVASPHGLARRMNGGNQAISVPLNLTNTDCITVVMALRVNSQPGSYNMHWEFTSDAQANQGSFGFYHQPGTGDTYATSSGAGGFDINRYTDPGLGSQIFVVEYDHRRAAGSQIQLWMGGRLRAPAAQPATAGDSGGFANSTLYVGARTASALWADQDAALFAVLDRRQTDKFKANLSLNPWLLFQPRRICVQVAPPSGIPVLSAATVTAITATGATPRVTITF